MTSENLIVADDKVEDVPGAELGWQKAFCLWVCWQDYVGAYVCG